MKIKVKIKIDPYAMVEDAVHAGTISAVRRFFKHREDCSVERLKEELQSDTFAYLISQSVMADICNVLDFFDEDET